MDAASNARSLAEIDMLCDQYEQGYRDGSLGDVNDEAHFDPWLQKIDAEYQERLLNELMDLRDDLVDCTKTAIIAEANSDSSGSRIDRLAASIAPSIWEAFLTFEPFEPLSIEAKLALAAKMESCQMDAGEMLLRSGQQADALYLIAHGAVDIVSESSLTGESGLQRKRIDATGAGAVVGEMSLLTGHPCAADVIAVTPVNVLRLSADDFHQVADQHHKVEWVLSELISERLGKRTHDALCGKTLGGFFIQRCISRGGMGVVYEAIDESDGSVRALKMLRHRFVDSPTVVARFDQECQLLKKLEHPHIVSVRGNFVAFRTQFIVLDLYDGVDLSRVLKRSGPLGETMARRVLGQIALGIQHAHKHDIMHLDLKPANILINRSGELAVSDFGLGMTMESSKAETSIVGTPPYMPPEQFTMSNIGPHCDWYSIGCIAYELLTGRRLFPYKDMVELVHEKNVVPSMSWPPMAVNLSTRKHVMSALQPLVQNRHLDLDTIASWARPLPALGKIAAELQPEVRRETKKRLKAKHADDGE